MPIGSEARTWIVLKSRLAGKQCFGQNEVVEKLKLLPRHVGRPHEFSLLQVYAFGEELLVHRSRISLAFSGPSLSKISSRDFRPVCLNDTSNLPSGTMMYCDDVRAASRRLGRSADASSIVQVRDIVTVSPIFELRLLYVDVYGKPAHAGYDLW